MKNKQKILVTGADGFIGSHLVEHLVRSGYSVRAFVYYNSFNSWGWLDHSPRDIKEAIEVVSGDVRDGFGVKEAARDCNVILHLAALISIPFSYHSPNAFVETNITGTLNVLNAARDLDLDRVVCTSTSEVYGSAQFVPITEDHPLVGQSPYSATKIGADQLALSFYRSFETRVTVLRPFNTYGPRQSARAVIPAIITQLLDGAEEIMLGALRPTRDFTFVSDTAKAFETMISADAVDGEVINAGSGFEISIQRTAELIAETIGCDLKIQTDEQRLRPEKSEVERLFAGVSKAQRLTGWSPEFGGEDGFRKGLTRTVDWFRDDKNRKQYKSNHYNI